MTEYNMKTQACLAWGIPLPEEGRFSGVPRQTILQRVLRRYKEQEGCCRCGFQDVRALQFHHRTPVGKNRVHPWADIEGFLDDLEDCDIVCANCHAIAHDGNTSKVQKTFPKHGRRFWKEHKDHLRNVFKMTYSEFVRYYTYLYGDEVVRGGNWHRG